MSKGNRAKYLLGSMTCDYEVPRMILLQASYLYVYLPAYSAHLKSTPLETFLEFQCGIAFSAIITFFGCLKYPEIFIPLRQTWKQKSFRAKEGE